MTQDRTPLREDRAEQSEDDPETGSSRRSSPGGTQDCYGDKLGTEDVSLCPLPTSTTLGTRGALEIFVSMPGVLFWS